MPQNPRLQAVLAFEGSMQHYFHSPSLGAPRLADARVRLLSSLSRIGVRESFI